ncbi:MAG TPA: hypothetical protein VFO10_12285 [Oligoflexus sp.]|jgi:hypothetical protein|uniref:hypothetical protein n=1 Tax=Oligoflexus sp. TaxID=1971216 RepID=UPI002D7FD05C|nr:hypothetical protein [Oligoflexus sp.]HET9238027.1 hypothetical protein [Oligoflexus sp.]
MKNDVPANVVDFTVFKRNKDAQTDLARGRTPLHVSHIDGKVKGSPHFRRPEADDFGDRMQRIKTSLEKINQLMTELKKTTRKAEFED